MPIFRNGRIEEVYWTYGYSPVFDDDGAIGGTLVVCTETTVRVLAARRLQSMGSLADATSALTDSSAVVERAARVIAEAPLDVAFALFCVSHTQDAPAVLARSAGLANETVLQLDSYVRTHVSKPFTCVR